VGVPTLKTVREVFDWYAANHFADFAAGAEIERRRVRRLFCAQYGNTLVADSIPAMLQEFIARQTSITSNWTRKRWRATICAPFNEAERVRLIERNPFRGLKIPRGQDGRDWSQEEFRAALRNCSAPLRRIIVFCRFSGARPGEARMMRWEHVNEQAEAVVLDKHKTAHVSAGPRRLHFNSVMLKLLLWLKKRAWGSRYVFLNCHKRPWTNSALTKQIRQMRERAGMPDDVVLNGCRHMFGTQAVINTGDLALVSELMGHSSLDTTRRYLHLANKKPHLNSGMERAIGRKLA
jgi:integrase